MKYLQNLFLKYEESIMKTIFSSIVIFIIFVGLIVSSKYFGLRFVFFNSVPSTGSGTNISTQTGIDISQTDTGSLVNTGSESTGSLSRQEYLNNLNGTGLTTMDDKVGYVLSFGKEGIDYMTKDTQRQDVILGKDKSQNNTFIQSFIQKYQYEFKINKTSTGYLVVETDKPVSKDRDMIFSMNGYRFGSVHKTSDKSKFKSDLSETTSDNIYIFPVNSIDIAQLKAPLNLKNFDKTNIAIAIGENDNTVVKLSLVYIN